MTTVVIYGGGFQPFHQGHMSSYLQAKKAFPGSDLYVVASNDTKVRPIPFESKKFLAMQAGVDTPFVHVAAPINPKEVLEQYDPNKDIFILVRSERDPVGYTKKDGSPGYFQPFVSIDKCESFATHGYVFVSKKHTFDIGGVEIYSGSQVRSLYAKANEAGKAELINGLYPKSPNKQKIKQIFDKYLSLQESIKYLHQRVLKEGTLDQKLRMQLLVNEALSRAPVKPFSQVQQFPLNSLLTGQGAGGELKKDPAYQRDIRRNKQVKSQRAAINARVKAGYPDDHDEGDWTTGT